MNTTRIELLLRYLDVLTKLNDSGHRCSDEINACNKNISDEFTKEPCEPQEFIASKAFTGFIDKGRNGND